MVAGHEGDFAVFSAAPSPPQYPMLAVCRAASAGIGHAVSPGSARAGALLLPHARSAAAMLPREAARQAQAPRQRRGTGSACMPVPVGLRDVGMKLSRRQSSPPATFIAAATASAAGAAAGGSIQILSGQFSDVVGASQPDMLQFAERAAADTAAPKAKPADPGGPTASCLGVVCAGLGGSFPTTAL